jgi:hypothetical protein
MPLPRMQRSADDSLTDQPVAHADLLELRVADIRKQALAPAHYLHHEVNRTPRHPLLGGKQCLVQLTLFLGGQRVQPLLLVRCSEPEQPGQTPPGRFARRGRTRAGGCQGSKSDAEFAAFDPHGHMIT